MTDTHSISESFDPEVSPANNRHVTVGYASRYPDHAHIPALTLKGQWLEAAGFATSTPVDVKVMDGCIVLTAQSPAPEESELMQSLRKVCKLSARKQKQVQEFIGVIAGKTRKMM
ncbi:MULTISPECIES: endoribonuclease SymE [unclassified Pseudocitrobacter]|uniref:endoribonuclease SymE n=1 Tax=unclassified Pseudocitrobacter TaxID=2638778 RepID=UPI0023E40705|nr:MULTISPECIES: endoribonuclease SymE [unclassified Pseudocitrobacter]MDF3828302.1 endoribonuclease SymE [Pseudocitrobacter sp. 2023EL-00150]MEC5374457.1 endoribonuclease SymE [Pseudocitrobacter sp. MW920760]